MVKPINSHISSDFHWIINSFLEKNNLKIIKQDIDSWLIKITEEWFSFVSFYEIKRSDININQWTPFKQDKNNYISLYELSKKLGITCYVLFYNKGKLKEKWIKIYKIKSKNWEEMFEEIWIFEFQTLRNNLLNLNKIKNNNIREKNLQWVDENIYNLLNNFSNYNHIFYTENPNQWWMIVSDPKTYKPIFLYKEIKDTLKENKIYDSAFIEISNKLNIPIFKFSYNEKDKVITFYENIKNQEIIKNLELNKFLDIYKNFILKS